MGDALDRIGKQVALFTTDSDAPKSSRVAYIGSSNVDAGKQAGEIALKALPNGGKCMGFVGLPGADNARERIEGFKDTIKGSKIELVDVRADDIDKTRSKRNVEDTLTAHPEINCMVGYYSYNTPDIYTALKDAGKLGQDHSHRLRRGSDHARRRQGRHDRLNRRPAALRVGLSGHEDDGEVSRRGQVGHSRRRPDDHPDQDHQQGQRRRLLG